MMHCTTLLPNFYPVEQHCSESVYFQSEWKTVWILISWLHEKPADPDLHCNSVLKKQINPGVAGQGVSSH